MQAIQKVFMAEEWVKDTRNKARFADNLRTKTSKALGTIEERRRQSIEADLRTLKIKLRSNVRSSTTLR